MPEGDTIFRAAAVMHRALAGKTVTRFETVLPRLARVDDQTPLRGRTIERVAATGKHLIIDFSGDLHLHTHMRMNGSWHLYRRGERWQRPRADMRLLIETEDIVAVGFNVPVAEFVAPENALRAVGPDLLGEPFDSDEAVARLRGAALEEIANALLDQRLLAGIGNIWKSETLFRGGIDPFARVDSLDDATLRRIVADARRLLKRGAAGRSQKMVYGRAGEPCRKCGTTIARRAQGPNARLTYWCPTCQPPR